MRVQVPVNATRMIDKSTRLITFIKKINKNAKQFNIEFYVEICFMKDDERGLTSIKSNRRASFAFA